MLWLALFAWAVLLCVLALTRERWAFVTVLVLTEVAGGSIDTAMNAEASHRLIDHPSKLVRLHALFNTGALVGAATAALVIHAGVLVALDVAGDRRRCPGGRRVAAATDSGTPMAAASSDEAGRMTTSHPLRRLRRDGLLVLLAVFALAEVTEGGVDTWGVAVPAQPSGHGRLVGGERVRGGATDGGDDAGRRGPVVGADVERDGVGGGRVCGGRGDLVGVGGAGGGTGRGGAGARSGRGVVVLAAGDEHGQPAGVAGGERSGDLHGGGVRRLGGGGADRGLGVAVAGAGPGIAGPGGGGVRGGGVDPRQTRSRTATTGAAVATAAGRGQRVT